MLTDIRSSFASIGFVIRGSGVRVPQPAPLHTLFDQQVAAHVSNPLDAVTRCLREICGSFVADTLRSSDKVRKFSEAAQAVAPAQVKAGIGNLKRAIDDLVDAQEDVYVAYDGLPRVLLRTLKAVVVNLGEFTTRQPNAVPPQLLGVQMSESFDTERG